MNKKDTLIRGLIVLLVFGCIVSTLIGIIIGSAFTASHMHKIYDTKIESQITKEELQNDKR